jgi:pimeloyl-ACP methyl ester carboxylesterase
LILYGNQDTYVPLAEQVYLSETLPDSEYVEIEGGTHFMAISHADVLGTAINDFLNTQVPAR